MGAALALPTAAEAERIHAGDRETINRYYMANLDYIQRCAYNYCRRAWRFCEAPDLAQEVYIIFSKLDFDSAAYFGHSLYKAFALYKRGGARKYEQAKSAYAAEVLYILDDPVKGLEKEGGTIGDCVPVPEREEKPDISAELFAFLSQYLAPEQKRVFACFYWTGCTYNEVAAYLNKNPRTVKRTREEVFKKFRKHTSEIYDFLESVDYDFLVA